MASANATINVELRFIGEEEGRVERRACLAELETRAEGDAPGGIVGYAAVYNQLSEPIAGLFRERIAPGAFSLALSKNPDVRALINHDAGQVLGRTASGTLRLLNTAKGLRFEIPELPDTSYARDLRASIRRGDVNQASFAFAAIKDVWSEEIIDGQPVFVRTLEEVDIFDVSVVTYPAYPQTEVSLRAAKESLVKWQESRGYPCDLAMLDVMAAGG